MTDFIETQNTRSAVRDLTAPIADITSFESIIQDVITTNPFNCTAYEDGGVTMPAITSSREHYTAKVVYENASATKIGTVSAQAPTIAGFTAAADSVMADTALSTAIGGTPSRDTGKDTYYCQLKCHDASGEIYYVTFSRTKVRVSSYSDDAIRSTVDAWADEKVELS